MSESECIGAVGTARELVELDPNLATRVAEIYVPLLSSDELSQIVRTGFELTNLSYEDKVREKIVYYSNNLAAVCHQLAYDICFNRKISRSKIIRTNITDGDFSGAVFSYVRKNSDTLRKLFDKIGTDRRRIVVLERLNNSQKDSLTKDEFFGATAKRLRLQQAEFLILIGQLMSSQSAGRY